MTHGAVLFELANHIGDRGGFLADGDVDTFDAGVLLIDDGIDGDGGLADLAVADDQFALAAPDRHHGIDCLETGLYRLIHGLPVDYPGGDLFQGVVELRIDRTATIDRVAERIDHPTFELGTDRNFEDATSAARLLSFRQLQIIAEDHRADRIPLQVQGHAVETTVKGDHLPVHHVAQAVDPYDAVGHGDDGSLILGLGGHIEPFDPLADQFADFRGIQLLHVVIPRS